jgi:MFS family permease
MLPVGVALDRWGVKPTALFLLTIAAIGAVLGAYADNAWSMLVAQMILASPQSSVSSTITNTLISPQRLWVLAFAIPAKY